MEALLRDLVRATPAQTVDALDELTRR
jgi:hypothetical protein